MPLGEFVSLQRGHDLPDERRKAGTVPILGSFGITGWHDEARAPGPGVTVGRSGASFGVVSFSPTAYWPLNTALYVTDFHSNDERFAYYLLKSFDFSSFNSGSAQPSLNRNFVHPVPIDVPSPSEQRAIARILGTLDDKIDLNRRMNETLEAMARALFKSWFVDFDPVRAKAAGRETGLPRDVADLFPDRLVDSELGEIPEGWSVGTLADVAVVTRAGVDPGAAPMQTFAHHSLPAFDDGQSPLQELGSAILSLKFKVPAGAVLVSRLNPEIERIWLVDVTPGDVAICSTEFLVLQPRAPFGRSFVFSLARSAPFRSGLQSLVTGTSNSHQRARPEAVMSIPVVRPDERVARAFDAMTSNLLMRSQAARRGSRTLAALRDALLPKLLSGELRVPDAERVVEAAT